MLTIHERTSPQHEPKRSREPPVVIRAALLSLAATAGAVAAGAIAIAHGASPVKSDRRWPASRFARAPATCIFDLEATTRSRGKMPSATGLMIGELATIAGVTPEAIRFYEREHVIPTARRGGSKRVLAAPGAQVGGWGNP